MREGPLATYPRGTRPTTSVTRLADIVRAVLDLNQTHEHTDGNRSWTGDVPKMRLAIQKLSAGNPTTKATLQFADRIAALGLEA
ncbi:hypothetical protein EA473_07640 [Natrarchaeobius chitinivorans]|uniref:Uncharacterized protein n=1 Tax=Natrarchaeobius chitinivorans TaxID=1679083 RepID=A0A3N6MNI2_NATCH|nr:hypothetical protein [Natrarchaeobius chitinivorans]RQG96036.1 hypothetical protein EA473_07640 [Natrarchaeobius chitinivorans]